MSVIVSVEAATYPVTVDEVKTNSCIEGTADDNHIGQVIIPAATQWAENITNRAFIERTLIEKTDRFEYEHEFRYPPLLSVDSITYIDNDGNSQTLATSIYDVDINSILGRITLAYGEAYPTTRQQVNAVTYTYKAGYSKVPTPIKSAILLLCGHLYENREQVTMGIEGKVLPMGAVELLGHYIIKNTV